jgi:malate synthase
MKNTLSTAISIPDSQILGFNEILTPEALEFLMALHQQFNQRRLQLLDARQERQKLIDDGQWPHFLLETKSVRDNNWTIAPIPADLQDRRVEITGPVDRKMVINALNSGAKVFMADFEDSNTPSWEQQINGQINLRDAINRNISFTNEKGKTYTLNAETAVLMVRPRGWHLNEKHLLINEEETSGSLMDFGLYFFHNAKNLIEKGSGPYFYLPKMESHLEARLWNDVFIFAQNYLNIPQGTIKATVLIETILASFELNEILFELRDHSAGLNCGRWDYIFSYIKKFKNHKNFILPDRASVTMLTPFMRSYSLLVIQTCHKRNAPAMGGMAAFIPIKNDEVANVAAFEKVRQDKLREATDGHDGTWVAHPGLVETAMKVFNEVMPTANQIHVKREDVHISEADLIAVPEGEVTEAGIRMNINVGILYIESWLNGQGAAAIYNLMEDAATAEISRAQIWQWLKYKVKTSEGFIFDQQKYHLFLHEELQKIKELVGEERYKNGRFNEATTLFNDLVLSENFEEFLTLQAYHQL